MGTIEAAAAWVDRVGLALLFPKADVVLPSLWEQVNGSTDENWAVREPDGTFVRWTEEMGFLWNAKDELPSRNLVCVGKHLARVTALIAPPLLPSVCAQADRSVPDGPAADVLDAVREHGPLTGPQLRDLLGAAKKDVDRAVTLLHRRLLLTSSHLVAQEVGWSALAHDLVDRKWRLPERLPPPEEARRELAGLLLARAGELTAADLTGALGWKRALCATVLDELAPSRQEADFRIWTAP
ncbi:MAG TPA: crosslink repair DNA glycosylase YcaQ family protein [Gaiellaceae bacterium]|nr:crosslink repair DNA glycosylase YcaQ family protein [Gaiellaceae bacterium]